MEERLNGFEYRDEDGKIILIAPLTDYGNASYSEVHEELLDWRRVSDIKTEPMECQKAYAVSGKCGFSSGKLVYIRHEITGGGIKEGESVRMLYDCIRNINFMKRRGIFDGFRQSKMEKKGGKK